MFKRLLHRLKDNHLDKYFADQKNKNQLAVLISAFGLILFLGIALIAPFRSTLFNLLFLKPASHATTVINLINNGGFENDLTNWTADGSTTITTNSPYEGVKEAHITGGSGPSMIISGQSNHTYMVTMWIRINPTTTCSGDCWGGFAPQIQNWPNLSSYSTSYASAGYLTPSTRTVGQWFKESLQFTIGSTTQGELRLSPFGGTGWQWDIDVDNVMFFEKPNPDIPPTVNISANTATVTSIASSVAFSSSADDEDGNVTYYFWDFGDGGHSNSINPSHSYTANGVYQAKLTVFDNSGSSATNQTTITVNDPAYPTLSVNSPPSTTNSASLVLTGTASPGSGNSITKIEWSTDRGLNGTASGTNSWNATIDLTNFGGKNHILINAYDSSGKIAKSDFFVNYTPSSTVSVIGGSSGVSQNSSSIEQYDKFEATFSLQNSQASNPYIPYETTLTDGMAHLNGTGISVYGIFTSPTGKVYSSPGFYYQPFDRDVVNKTIVPSGNAVWKIRFSPQELGTWTYQIQVFDASGTSTVLDSSKLTFNAVTPTNTYNHGFLHVSQTDSRYFEFSDGTPFVAVGNGARITDTFSTDTSLATVGLGTTNFTRDWMSGSNVSGSSWAPWSAGAHFGSGDNHPAVDLTTDEAYGNNLYSLYLDADTAKSDPCVFYDFYGNKAAVKANTNYKISIRVKTVGITGTGGFTFRPQNTFPNNCNVASGQSLTIPYQSGTSDWHMVTGSWNSGSNHDIGYAILTLENVTSGKAYIDEVSIKEDLGNGNLGPEIMPRANFNIQNYFSQSPSYNWDYGLDKFAQNGLYDKIVLEEKSDFSYDHISPYGYGTSSTGQIGLSGAAITYQQFFWRYLAARWGYSRAVHSFEFANEQAPGDLTMAENLATYIHSIDPQHHLANTSNWSGLSGGWTDPKYPDIDYADAHSYIGCCGDTTWFNSYTYPKTIGSTTIANYNSLYSDTALYTIAHSIDQWLQNAAGNKPIVLGEVGIGNNVGVIAGDSDSDSTGVWFHQWVWPQMNPGAAYMLYWFTKNIDANNLHTLAKPYREFMEGQSGDTINKRIPLNNGHYQDIGLTLPAGINGTGQIDTVNGGAHFWLYDNGYTWLTPTGGASLAGKTISFPGLPAKSYLVEYWNTWNGTVYSTETNNFSGGALSLTIPAGFPNKDIAVKIIPTSGYIANQAAPLPSPNGVPTTPPSASVAPTSTPSTQMPSSTPAQTVSATPTPTTQVAITPNSPSSANVSGDLNDSGRVDIFDLSILLRNWNHSGLGDLNSDGSVNIYDLSILLRNWNI